MAESKNARHHVVIGSGIAGSQAADTLRSREPDARVTILTLSSLLFYNRYDLPKVFRGHRDWREFLAYPAEYYKDKRIEVRRCSRVAGVDGSRRTILLDHKEEIRFDTLLVASGGRGYIPEELADFRPLMRGFSSYTEAVTAASEVPDKGHVIMLGGDMIGLDLARTLIDTRHRVTLVAGPQTFWPHEVTDQERPGLIAALEKMGVEVIEAHDAGGIASIEQGARGLSARRVLFNDGSEVHGDVVMPFFGLSPSVEFMLGSGTDIERGLLVNPALRTTCEGIYAAGDVCQIWSDAEKRYRFFYGWKNVRAMGDLAARNIAGGDEPWVPAQDEKLHIAADGSIQSAFWEYH
jgi:NAD(P)H-nitrite reductase large subunit